ncbi:CatB-related O-acetyltransferase [Pseudooceanicola sp.]|uniref:CatB-related O-acetyltransferase n=1 Tax=Pseudooceanicola sp. TaxID=1914328 RepID=UPI00261ACE87|nr:CatB-related O-acetyltransferase [Pseudooceanicola sp.]MDF1855343.1 CatB-related O-acetyltransferase [Pseudooceanicola sp.]
MPDGTSVPSVFQLTGVKQHPNISVGRYAYASDNALPADILQTIAPYLFPGAPEKLSIGPFCQIAEGVRIITSSANHPMDGATTYPFAIFNPARMVSYAFEVGPKPDTVIGADCWIGRDALILPGAVLGHGVIVQAGAVVRGHVPDYAIVGGNPAQVIRMRFPDPVIARLLDLAWWDWPEAAIIAAIPALEANDIDGLAALRP